jgi:hypothetical protein
MEATGCGRRVGFSFLVVKAFVAAVSFSQLPFSFLFQELDWRLLFVSAAAFVFNLEHSSFAVSCVCEVKVELV